MNANNIYLRLLMLAALFYSLLAVTGQKAQAQCTSVVGTFPATVNGVTVTFSSTNPVPQYSVSGGSAYTNCGTNFTPNSQFYGNNPGGSTGFTNVVGTYTFSAPVNDIRIAASLSAQATGGNAESFAFATNGGTTSLTALNVCNMGQSGTTITGQAGGSAGQLTVHATTPFTTLTLTYNKPTVATGSNSGALFHL